MNVTNNIEQRKLRFIILVFIALLTGFLLTTVQTHAVSPWHEVYLTPGQTYDVSKAKTNTTVYINKAGDYTLKGDSTKCRVVIQSGGVNVYLADGLEIDPGIGAYVGSRTAAITVNDMSGTVKLISKPGADVYFGGYLTAPAVRKYGYNSKLVFETEDPSIPGTITAYRAHASSSAGIGSAYEFSGRVSTGNIEINSGNIIATGGYMSAGIGGGGNGNAYYISINGGNVRAVGGSNGSGIGGGYHGNAANITINNGTVYAEGTVGAGIGSGEQSSYAKNIVINGGNITAKSDTGAAIGGGQRSEVENLRINGGTVNASSRETAIGGSADQHFGDVKSLYITGGKITANAGHVGIGAAGSAPGPNNIFISGGDITATSDYYAIGGGGFSGVLDDDRITNVTISGGTIKADGGKEDIGTNHAWMDKFNIVITGGSLLAERQQMYNDPKDQYGNTVHRTNVTLDGLTGNTAVTGAYITKLNDSYPDYGLDDVRTNNGMLHFWIPDNMKVKTVSAAGSDYRGNVESATNGTLYPDTRIRLNSDDSSLAHGIGTVYKGAVKLDIINEPTISEGNEVAGYIIENTGIHIADADGTLKADVSGYTDPEGKWIREYETGLKFKARVQPMQCKITYDTNVPSNTASIVEVNGNATETVLYGGALLPPICVLKGYTFGGWYAKADCSGEPVKIAEGNATLYAKWTPKEYTVKFDSNGGSGDMEEQTMIYDKPAELKPNTFEHPENDMRFLGWKRAGVVGGTLRADQSTVVNLCNYSVENDTIEGYILNAQWTSKDQPIVIVTKDGNAYQGREVELKKDTYNIKLTESGAEQGVYSINISEEALESGKYRIYVNNSDTGMDISIGTSEADANFASVEYYTVEVSSDQHLKNAGAGVDGTDSYGEQIEVIKGTIVNVSVNNAEDYIFDTWSAIECSPEYVDGTSANSPSAKIKVDEKTTLKALSKPAPPTYTIYFNGNGADRGATKEISFIYDQEGVIPECGYYKVGYHFIGWNSEIDGTGTTYYMPGEKVGHLTSEPNGCTTLYAVWEHDYYTIKYDVNGGEGEVPDIRIWTDEEYLLSNPGFMREEHVLTGWNTASDGSGTAYDIDENIRNIADKDETLVLYAQWEYDPAADDEPTIVPEDGNETHTGDKIPLAVLAIVMVIALIGAATVLFGRRRKP